MDKSKVKLTLDCFWHLDTWFTLKGFKCKHAGACKPLVENYRREAQTCTHADTHTTNCLRVKTKGV